MTPGVYSRLINSCVSRRLKPEDFWNSNSEPQPPSAHLPCALKAGSFYRVKILRGALSHPVAKASSNGTLSKTLRKSSCFLPALRTDDFPSADMGEPSHSLGLLRIRLRKILGVRSVRVPQFWLGSVTQHTCCEISAKLQLPGNSPTRSSASPAPYCLLPQPHRNRKSTTFWGTKYPWICP